MRHRQSQWRVQQNNKRQIAMGAADVVWRTEGRFSGTTCTTLVITLVIKAGIMGPGKIHKQANLFLRILSARRKHQP